VRQGRVKAIYMRPDTVLPERFSMIRERDDVVEAVEFGDDRSEFVGKIPCAVLVGFPHGFRIDRTVRERLHTLRQNIVA